MRRRRRKNSQRKLELVSLIDVIFLLLIFFMVTLNIIPAMTRPEPLEGSFSVDVPRASTDKVDKIVQLEVDTSGTLLRYLVFDKGLGDNEREVRDWLVALQRDASLTSRAPEVLEQRRVLTRIADLEFEDALQTVVIRSPQYATYGQILAVVNRCRTREGVKVHLARGSILDLAAAMSFDSPDSFDRINPN